MSEKLLVSFEEIFLQNERRMRYHFTRLYIQKSELEGYQDSLYMKWWAYKKFRPDMGILASYFNYE